MFSKVFIVSLVVVAAFARPDKFSSYEYEYRPPAQQTYAAPLPLPTYAVPEESSEDIDDEEEEELTPVPYNFEYKVNDEEYGTDFSHKTDSDGEDVKGEYRVALPDGRTQVVKYSVSKGGGYIAEVTYEGEAKPYVPPTEGSEETGEDEAVHRAYVSPAEESEETGEEEPAQIYQAPEFTYQIPARFYGYNY